MFEHITQEFTTIVEDLQNQFSKLVNITKQSKIWWNKEYNRNLVIYQTSRRKTDWINYRKTVEKAKRVFFDSRI